MIVIEIQNCSFSKYFIYYQRFHFNLSGTKLYVTSVDVYFVFFQSQQQKNHLCEFNIDKSCNQWEPCFAAHAAHALNVQPNNGRDI